MSNLEFTVKVIHVTTSAVLFFDGEENKWVPKKLIGITGAEINKYDIGEEVMITIPEWFAIENEWV